MHRRRSVGEEHPPPLPDFVNGMLVLPKYRSEERYWDQTGLHPYITLEPVCGVTFTLTGTRRKPVQTGIKPRPSGWERDLFTCCISSAFTGSDKNLHTCAIISTFEAGSEGASPYIHPGLLSRGSGIHSSTSERRLFEVHFLGVLLERTPLSFLVSRHFPPRLHLGILNTAGGRQTG